MSYYDRTATTHIDGSPVFKTPEDEAGEIEVAKILQDAWKCKLKTFGKLSAVDWFAERDGRLIGIVELKSRTHAADKYPTVFLNVRKWLALLLSAVGLGVPAVFVVRFTDSVRYIPVAEISPAGIKIGGCRTQVKATSDVEPVIEVLISDMKVIH